MRPLNVCFVAPRSFAVLAGRDDLDRGGGAEVQQMLLARELARRGHRVSAITYDHGQVDELRVAGIRLFKAYAPQAGLPGLRFVAPRWTALCRALRRADAEVYYQRGAGAETGQVALWCRSRGRRFVFGVASDRNCLRGGRGLNLRERWLYCAGLRQARPVIAQTRAQQRQLQCDFGVPAALLRSCAPDPYDINPLPPARELGQVKRLLWVGRFAPVKRVEMFLRLADQLPDCLCELVGPIPASSRSRALLEQAYLLPNVIVHGRLPPAALEPLYERAAALVCTSELEGFPNTFLEAWARGVPTISTVDPDGAISDFGLGAVAGSVDEMAAAVRRLTDDPLRWQALANRARRHFLQHHTIEHVVEAFERILADPVGAASAPTEFRPVDASLPFERPDVGR